ncbi:MAG: toxin-antitoxin system HicB family antitoxin [Chloroflexota bacterium]
MAQLTLRLPETLHRQLESLAASEAISLNQYIVYALTRWATLAYTVQALPENAIREQRAAYAALLQSLGQASFDKIEDALRERTPVEAEEGLTPEILQQLSQRLEGSE